MSHTHADAARRMVESQLRARGIRDERVLAAMEAIPRHRFVPSLPVEDAYADRALATRDGQTISQPYIVALMTGMLDVQPGCRVLEVGTGSGYQTAILATLGAEVVTMERHEGLSSFAKEMLATLELDAGLTFVVGDGSMGYPALSPYDRILVTAGAPRVPPALREQLAAGGRIVIPVGDRSEQNLIIARYEGEEWIEQRTMECKFVPLIGEQGWA
ncbi:MAG: protein-L-isoaspartate(D-aspartate) O-methyltransferase [Phycisphaeraceae bacterium]